MKLVTTVSALALSTTAAFADCDSVTMSDVGWTDITTTTAAAKHVLEALGYDVDVKVLSVPVTFASLESDDVDVFLGNWMPAQNGAITPYLDSGEIESINTNLEGTKYTLATTQAAWDAGLQSYADIARFEDELDGKIYGIEPGNEGNAYLVSLIDENKHGLENFEVVESSEQGMLAQARRLVDDGEFIVFLGWEPHPMNANFDLQYLPGGEDFFGGEGVVNTVTRKGFAEECPNLGKLFGQMDFSLPMENLIMGQILDDGADPEDATLDWIRANPDAVTAWVDGVTTVDGEDGTAAVKSELGL
ncbi:glycine/betaine ABC transporter substrate-binding protein [Salipiger aestuarii]|uniref:Glycine betaine/proline transport system substrate-binding protein n=1 Tax=Salipiger aestuarii TaxID=568098 RepID=A0A327YSR6_9RHOB|nr:choline ABC transporter substrate-binding protein [Salipiger aestuarii]EIE49543.1 substrate-binding region of ABC-type glycine betaine transport system [Citreicella sp. 357]KAA8610135.1 glycine/betaine ABC transporter substrate-binding protein [Salipiger aestuarii]KAA8616058.1 glycine/betaine ABC transporter substrate-binding protein [Salipiger aestuarii]KAB2543334.1 glycine/betaine ABC transporter substrate-binding protein [Salipiger aestuarii]RAK24000.1 glycine betaine/proline transport s